MKKLLKMVLYAVLASLLGAIFGLTMGISRADAESILLTEKYQLRFEAPENWLPFTSKYESPALQKFLGEYGKDNLINFVKQTITEFSSEDDIYSAGSLIVSGKKLVGYAIYLVVPLYVDTRMDYTIRPTELYDPIQQKDALSDFASDMDEPYDDLMVNKFGQVFVAARDIEEAYGFGKVMITVANGCLCSVWVVNTTSLDYTGTPDDETMKNAINALRVLR